MYMPILTSITECSWNTVFRLGIRMNSLSVGDGALVSQTLNFV